jgi:hydroxyacylglutathione hydrolase
MIFRRIYHDRLAQASYLIACESTRQAIVVDPLRDPAPYLEAASLEDVRITAVTETHLHADFLSGAEELARVSGAQLALSVEGSDPETSDRVRRTGAVALRDGSVITAGRVRLDVKHTPGHTPEHLSFLVTDEATGELPVGLVTGDFVFVGDVGRPDLLERAVGVQGSMRRSAAELFRSVRGLDAYPDYLQIWPGHGAGSSCGRSLGAVPQSTLGYEKRTNWAFQIAGEQKFVDEVLREQPDPPAYFARMKQLNARGIPPMPRFASLPTSELRRAAREGAIVVDTRPSADFLAAHSAGSINIPLGRSFLHWIGSLLQADDALVLIVTEETDHLDHAIARELALIGFDNVLGVLSSAHLDSLIAQEVARIPVTSAADFVPAAAAVSVLDVRNDAEWNAGHIPGAIHIPLTQLVARVDELRGVGPLVVHCQGGARSSIAASVLRANGIDDVTNLDGGYPAWVRNATIAAGKEL